MTELVVFIDAHTHATTVRELRRCSTCKRLRSPEKFYTRASKCQRCYDKYYETRKEQALDVPMHLLGGAAIAWFFWSSLAIPECRPVLGSVTVAAAGLMSLAATGTTTVLWELAEWSSDRFLGTHTRKGLDDTLLDMVLGFVGGLAILLVKVARSPPRSQR